MFVRSVANVKLKNIGNIAVYAGAWESNSRMNAMAGCSGYRKDGNNAY